MTLYDGAGQADGSTALAATGALFGVLGGSGTGSSGGSASGNANFGGGGIAAGVAGGSGTGNIEGVLAGTASGVATVEGETHPWGAGTAMGSGALSPADGLYLAGGVGTASGAASMTGAGGVIYLGAGVASGLGELLWDYFVDGAGTVVCAGSMTGSGFRIRNFKGFTNGSTTLVWSFPLPMVGKTVMVGHAEVAKHLVLRAIVAPDKCFRWLQLLQRGDCSIFISDAAGPISPVVVTFTMYQLRPNGTRFQVGPSGRIPVRGVVGEFYATGRAGEGGQPGLWVIRWEYRRSFQAPVEVREQTFQVLDAVAAADPRDVAERYRKYGWN